MKFFILIFLKSIFTSASTFEQDNDNGIAECSNENMAIYILNELQMRLNNCIRRRNENLSQLETRLLERREYLFTELGYLRNYIFFDLIDEIRNNSILDRESRKDEAITEYEEKRDELLLTVNLEEIFDEFCEIDRSIVNEYQNDISLIYANLKDFYEIPNFIKLLELFKQNEQLRFNTIDERYKELKKERLLKKKNDIYDSNNNFNEELESLFF